MKFRTLSLLVALVMAAASCGGSESASSAAISDSDDLSDLLATSQDDLEELLQASSTGSGTGVINVLDVDYIFTFDVCFVDGPNFDASGPGIAPDGTPFWGSVSSSLSTREEMESTGLPEANLDAFFGDKDSVEGLFIELELGKADRFTSAEDGLADLSLDLFDAASSDDTSYRIDGNALSGSGQIRDWNGVLIPSGETATVNFTATCG